MTLTLNWDTIGFPIYALVSCSSRVSTLNFNKLWMFLVSDKQNTLESSWFVFFVETDFLMVYEISVSSVIGLFWPIVWLKHVIRIDIVLSKTNQLSALYQLFLYWFWSQFPIVWPECLVVWRSPSPIWWAQPVWIGEERWNAFKWVDKLRIRTMGFSDNYNNLRPSIWDR